VTHAEFLRHVDDENTRARTFERTAGVLLVSADKSASTFLSHTLPRIRDVLRPVDRIAIFSHTMLEILVPETDAKTLVRMGHLMQAAGTPNEPSLRVGLSLYPGAGHNAVELLDEALATLRSTTPTRSMQGPTTAASKVAVRASRPAAPADDVIVVSPSMHDLYETASKLASQTVPVLVLGETRVGKELVARAIHNGGDRRDAPLISTNCGAIPTPLIQSVLFGHEGVWNGLGSVTRPS
jgi:hypothetical protein